MTARQPLVALLVALAASTGCKQEVAQYQPLDPWQDTDADYGSWLSMDVAPDGRLAVAYYDKSRGALGFAVGSPAADGSVQWEHEQVDGYPDQDGLDRGDRGKWASMKVAPDGTVWIAYHDVSNGGLRVAHRVGKTWTSDIADAGAGLSPNAGQWASLALDAEGNPVVAHHDAGKGVLRVARLADGAWTAETALEGDDWTGVDPATGETVTRPANVGQFARLLIHGNTEYIACYDAAERSLVLVEGFPGTYAHSVVHEDVDVGQWPSMWTDGAELAIAFQDVAAQDLLLATRSGTSTFTVTVVDDGEYVGADTELFRKDGDYAILYFDGKKNDMKLATHAGGAWSTGTVAGDGRAVGFHNEVVALGDQTWAASYDYTSRRIFLTAL